MKQTWQTLLQTGFSHVADLLAYLELTAADLPGDARAEQAFAFKVPRPFAARMVKGDPRDPLLRQVLPVTDELQSVSGFSQDPLGEQTANVMPGLLHKYTSRVLLILTGNCAINCRYCFRRTFDYAHNRISRAEWEAAFAYIASDTSIEEVILSGGDPLLVSDAHLAFVLQALEAIPHVVRVRIHSRIPIVLPQRLTSDLLNLLGNTRFSVTLVVHANHAQELDDSVAQALDACRQMGLMLLNQSVLLAGVNDSVSSLAALSRRLWSFGVHPYYLHLLDPVTGTAHFQVKQDTAVDLLQALRAEISGYLIPRLCYEQAGASAKIILF